MKRSIISVEAAGRCEAALPGPEDTLWHNAERVICNGTHTPDATA